MDKTYVFDTAESGGLNSSALIASFYIEVGQVVSVSQPIPSTKQITLWLHKSL